MTHLVDIAHGIARIWSPRGTEAQLLMKIRELTVVMGFISCVAVASMGCMMSYVICCFDIYQQRQATCEIPNSPTLTLGYTKK